MLVRINTMSKFDYFFQRCEIEPSVLQFKLVDENTATIVVPDDTVGFLKLILSLGRFEASIENDVWTLSFHDEYD